MSYNLAYTGAQVDSAVAANTGIVSVTDPLYGAIGDGVTDDTAAIQAALDAGGIFIPPGTYKITSKLTVTNNTDKEVKRVIGSGAGDWNDAGLSSHRTIIKNYGDDHAFEVGTLGQTVFQDLSIQNGHGSRSQGAGIYGSVSGSLCGVTIKNVHVHSHWDGIYLDSPISATLDSVITRNCDNDGIVIVGNASAQPSMVTCNSCFAMISARDGWNIANSSAMTLNSCGTDYSGRHGIHLYDNGAFAGDSYSTTLNACFSEQAGQSEEGYGIYLNGSESVTLISPHVVLSGYAGIRINSIRSCTIISPYLDNNTLFGIHVDAIDYGELTLINPRWGAGQTSELSDAAGEVTVLSSGNLGTADITHTFRGHVKIDRRAIKTIRTLADEATPSVKLGDVWLTGGTTTITDFDDGLEGQQIEVIAEHSLDITDGTNIFLSGSANWSMTATDTLTLICKADNKWYELSRSDSGA
jgi:hypothetical protein